MTPIDWLKSQLENYGDPQCCELTWDELDNLLLQAKAMEKEQIKDAYEYGYWRGNNEDDFEPEEYYKNPYCNPNNESYGK